MQARFPNIDLAANFQDDSTSHKIIDFSPKISIMI